MSWVEKLHSGRHKAVYRNGPGQRFSKTFAKRADARRWLAATDTDRARGQWVDPRGGVILLEDWAVRGGTRPTRSGSTIPGAEDRRLNRGQVPRSYPVFLTSQTSARRC